MIAADAIYAIELFAITPLFSPTLHAVAYAVTTPCHFITIFRHAARFAPRHDDAITPLALLLADYATPPPLMLITPPDTP